MKKGLYFLVIIGFVSIAFHYAYAVKKYNASKSNTSSISPIDSADREVSRLVDEAEKEATEMAAEMIRMERANGYTGKVEIQVSVDVQIAREQKNQPTSEANPIERKMMNTR